MSKPRPKIDTSEMPLVAHLVELRNRLLKVVLFILVVFLCFVPFANDLYTLLAKPLMAHLPEGASMIATEVASPFFTPFKLTLVFSIFLSMPFLLYQGWAFIAPGLYQHERRMVVPLLASSTGLFYLGGVFAYFVVFPIVFGFFTSAAPEGVSVMTDIAKYLDFVLKMFFAFGLAFEVPIATIVLVWAGITTPQSLGAKRPYVIVGAFVIGMLLTPPDAISQTLLAVPMILLFEVGLFFSKAFVRKREEEEESEAAEEEPEENHIHQDAPESSAHRERTVEEEFLNKDDLTDDEFEAEFDRAQREEQGLYDENNESSDRSGK